MQTSVPPKVRLIDVNGERFAGNTQPEVGQTDADFSLPVVLARGVDPTQTFISVPALDKTSNEAYNNSVKRVVDFNATRRYLKIINNGAFDVELWTGFMPGMNDVGLTIPKGEVLQAYGFGIYETDTCRVSLIYATCVGGATGLMVQEG